MSRKNQKSPQVLAHFAGRVKIILISIIAQKPLTEILCDADLTTISPDCERLRKSFKLSDLVKVWADYA